MKMPKQRRAVERKVNRHAAAPAGQKVGPSAWYDTLIQSAPGILTGLGRQFKHRGGGRPLRRGAPPLTLGVMNALVFLRGGGEHETTERK
jgi:hypothetical protein